jgi:plasmid stabilization system protein ParE
MTGYVLTRNAEADVLEIFRYIADDGPSAAIRVRDRLFEAFERLAKRPALGHARPDLTDKPPRFWTVQTRHTVVYRGEQPPIEILRVLGPGRDAAALLR